jgi:phosphoglycerate kinase
MKKTIKDIDISEKKVIVRVDFNVPLNDALQITDDTRIRGALPTIDYLLKQKAKVILMSHLGRPKGKVQEKYSLKPVAKRLGEILNMAVKMAPGSIDEETKKLAGGLKPGEILLLENLRFDGREEKNDETFAKELASLAQVFIQDAFGTVHRAHASTAGIAKCLPGAGGLLLEKEMNYFSKVLDNPVKPYVAILGGAKVSDKIPVIKNLLGKIDALIVGGAMAYTFLKSKGIDVGSSLVEEDKIPVASEIIKLSRDKKTRIFLPIDHVIADKVSPDAQVKKTQGVEIPGGWLGVDIGSMTIERISSVILSARTIVWNGPMGVFEIDKFADGTDKVASLVSKATEKGAVSIIGGGDTVSAVKKAGLTDKMSHISTGGGASIELLEGKILPGIDVLPEK